MFECTLKNAQKGDEKAVLHQCNHHLDYHGETEPPFAEKHNRKHVLTLLRGLADRPLPGAAALAGWLTSNFLDRNAERKGEDRDYRRDVFFVFLMLRFSTLLLLNLRICLMRR